MFKIETFTVANPEEFVNHYKMVNGFENKLGSGMYASVFESPNSPHVLKVCRDDYSYLGFVKHLQAQKKPNRFLPQIFKCIEVKPEKKSEHNTHFAIVEMEKLVSFEDNTPFKKIVQGIECIIDKKHLTKAKKAELCELIDQISPFGEVPQSVKIEFIDAISLLVKAKKKTKGSALDIHDGNIMVRKSTNTFVFTDPLCNND